MLILFAITAPAVIAFAALGSEGGLLYYKKTSVQGVADMAVVSAANASGGTAAAIALEARAIAASLGYANGKNGVTVTVISPPADGAYAGQSGYVEVFIKDTQQPLLSRIIHPSAYLIEGRAVASAGGSGSGCVLALDKAASASINVGGTASATFNACDAISDSTSANSVYNNGGGTMVATEVYSLGGIASSGITATLKANQTRSVANPYSGVVIPSSGSWGSNQTVPNAVTITLNPGVYSSFQISNGMTVTLNPGTYYLDQTSLKITGGAITGTGVTFVLTSSKGAATQSSKWPSVAISGNPTINVTAPTSGTYQGIVVYGDPLEPVGTSYNFTGGAGTYFGGAIVAPTAAISFSGTGVAGNGQNCTQLIGDTVSFTGTSSISTSCSNYGTKSFSPAVTAIVE